MMKNNETLPDIEKLGHDEFNLDSEEQQRLQMEGEQHVQQVRVRIRISYIILHPNFRKCDVP